MSTAIKMEIVWDIDGDIEHDLASGDKEMREFAEVKQETGLTMDYAETNASLLLENLGLDEANLDISIDLEDSRILISKKEGNFDLEEVEVLVKEADINICESSDDTVYVQLYSYFQVQDFCFVDDVGSEHPIYLL